MAVISQLKKKSKNLFNYKIIPESSKIAQIENGIRVTNSYLTYTGVTCEQFLQMTGLKQGDTATFSQVKTAISGTDDGVHGRWIFRSNDSQTTPSLQLLDYYQTSRTFTIPENFDSEHFLTLAVYGRKDGIIEFTNIQIEKGETATEYQPYYLNITKYNNELLTDIYHKKEIFKGLPLGNYHFAKNTEKIGGYCENAVEEPIIDMKISGNSVQGKLPSEYQQVEYLESTGTQYINTGIIPTSNTGMKVVMSDLVIRTNDFNFLGTRSANVRFAFVYNNGKFAYGYGNQYISQIPFPTGSINTLEMNYNNDRTLKANNDVLFTDLPTVDFSGVIAPIAIFGQFYQGSLSLSSYKVYSFQITENDIVVRDLVPCYSKTDNIYGMYDLVNNIFYTNAGTGNFIVGLNTPTPEKPVEIESVGEKTKNLINYKDFILSGYTKEIENGIQFEITGKRIEFGKPFTFKAKTTYVISAECTGDAYFGGQLFSNFGSYGWCNATTKSLVIENLTDTDITKYIMCVDTTGTKGSTIKFAMLEINSSATEYEPYGYKVPVKASGKNLFDIKNALLIDNWLIGDSYNYFPLNLQIGKTYTISGENTELGSSNINLRLGRFNSTTNSYTRLMGLLEPSTTELKKRKITLIADGTECLYSYSPGYVEQGELTNLLKVKVINIQVEEGETATDYSPYIEPTTTKIYLTEPLRKVGDYADYIDYKNKKVVRNFKKVDLSILNWTVYSDNGFRCYLDNCKPSPINGLANILNSHYRLVTMSEWNNKKPNYTMALNDITKPDLRIRNTDYENVEDFIQSLEGVYVIYELATPTEETIDIPEITTSKGTNNFVVETTLLPSEIKINYWKQI